MREVAWKLVWRAKVRKEGVREREREKMSPLLSLPGQAKFHSCVYQVKSKEPIYREARGKGERGLIKYRLPRDESNLEEVKSLVSTNVKFVELVSALDQPKRGNRRRQICARSIA